MQGIKLANGENASKEESTDASMYIVSMLASQAGNDFATMHEISKQESEMPRRQVGKNAIKQVREHAGRKKESQQPN